MLDYRTHTFLEVYRQRSYTRAARSLMVSQPAVSQQLRQLEAHYGCELFVRRGHEMVPTPAADLLYEHLAAMECDESRLCREVGAIAGEARPGAVLRFGCTRTISDFVAPRLIAAHLARHPDVTVRMRADNTAGLLADMDRGDIDFALVEGSFDRDLYDSELLMREEFVAVSRPGAVGAAAGAGAAGAGGAADAAGVGASGAADVAGVSAAASWPGGGRPTSVRDLLGETLYLREEGSGSRDILVKHLAARDLSPEDFARVHVVQGIPVIKRCLVEAGGVSFVYRCAVAAELAGGVLEDVTPDDFHIAHDLRLVWQRDSTYASVWRALAGSWREALVG